MEGKELTSKLKREEKEKKIIIEPKRIKSGDWQKIKKLDWEVKVYIYIYI